MVMKKVLILGMLLFGIINISAQDVTVTLKSNGVTGNQVVSFGLPMPRNTLYNAANVAVFDGASEIPAYVARKMEIFPSRRRKPTNEHRH